MSTTTANLDLIKPTLTDSADITQFNANWDKIDTNITQLNNNLDKVDEDITQLNNDLDNLDIRSLDKTTKRLTSADDLNKVFTPGFYTWYIDDTPMNAPDNNMTVMRVFNLSGSYHVTQELFSCDLSLYGVNQGCMMRRFISSSTTHDWEWVIPSLYTDQEYKTSERWNGETVYVKLDSDGIVHKRTESGKDITPITYGTTDLTAGTSALTTGQLYFVYE